MAGYIYFGEKEDAAPGHGFGVSLGSQFVDFIAWFLEPYLKTVGDRVVEDIFQSFYYDSTMNFSRLTSEEYMQCYVQMKKAFEVDLAAHPIYRGRSQEWAVKDWFDEIKVKMQSAPLFNRALINEQN